MAVFHCKCEHCGIEFVRSKRPRRYCGRRCRALDYHATHIKTVVSVCAACGTEYVMPQSLGSVQKYCSRACYRKRALKHTRTFTCRQCGIEVPRGARGARATYCSVRCRAESRRKGGSISSQGYRVVSVEGRPLLEHRVVMERMLGRPLESRESVHHRDGNRLNNDPANLELWDRGQPAGQRVAEKIAGAIALLHVHGYAVVAPIGSS